MGPAPAVRVARRQPAEHLAARLLHEHGPDALAGADDLAALVRTAAEEAYDEGYERGVHDHDATAILTALLPLHDGAGTLRHAAAARARALLFWAHGTTEPERADWTLRARSLARVRDAFGAPPALDALRDELARAVGSGTRTPRPARRRAPRTSSTNSPAGPRGS